MRRAGGLALLAALAAGCSTGSIEDLPTAAGSSTVTLSARGEAVQGLAAPRPGPVDGSALPRLVPDGSGGYVRVEPAPAYPPSRGYAELAPQAPAGPPQPVPPPRSPIEYFRGLEHECSSVAALVSRGDRPDLPRIESDRFRDARVVSALSPATVLIEDGRGTRLLLRGWSAGTGRVLPESGRAGDPLREPYRSGCPTSTFGAGA